MKPWTIGLSTGFFYRRSIFDVLGAIRDSGFETIEVCSYPQHLDYHDRDAVVKAGEMLRELGMRPVSFHAPFADGIDITAPDAGLRAVGVHELITACEAATAMGVENIVLHPGPERQGHRDNAEFVARMRHAAGSLNHVAERCQQLGVHLVLENMLPHLLFGHISDMLYLLGTIRSTAVGTCLDTGHAFLARELDTVIPKLSGHLHLVHVNDNRGERDEHLPPGEGHIDWPAVIRNLVENHFQGVLILELSAGPDEPVESMLGRATQSRDYLTTLMKGLQ